MKVVLNEICSTCGELLQVDCKCIVCDSCGKRFASLVDYDDHKDLVCPASMLAIGERDPREIGKSRLVSFVQELQSLLYVDPETGSIDPNYPWDSDTLGELGALMIKYRFAPDGDQAIEHTAHYCTCGLSELRSDPDHDARLDSADHAPDCQAGKV